MVSNHDTKLQTDFGQKKEPNDLLHDIGIVFSGIERNVMSQQSNSKIYCIPV